ncbi:MAG: sigma-70 family RNA polymerase sigma factor [Crocinitomicaceae bacterium]|nr:sigma-70 family RNA polymerase sigma factor [Crocinitomicaceae bacterium]
MDKELIELYKEDKNAGFKAILDTYQERVYWQIRRMLKTHEATEDVMQNTFIKVWNALPKFREESNLYTWIYRIAFNESTNYLNKENKMPSVEYDPPLFESKNAVFGNDYTGEEIESLLYKALNLLPEKQKIVFELKYFDELKFKEISKITGTSEGGLKASYHLAVKKIKEYFETL